LAGSDGLALLEFESGVELRAGRDKGSAVREILRESAPDTPVAFLGDDFTDESAFRAVNSSAAHGLSVLVRRKERATEARLWIRPPEELKRFLNRWKNACTAIRER
jgi:trehalose-phosphatase